MKTMKTMTKQLLGTFLLIFTMMGFTACNEIIGELDNPVPENVKENTHVLLSELTGTEFEAYDGVEISGTAGANLHVTIPDGVTITLKDAKIKPTEGVTTAAVVCLGDATIKIEGTNVVEGMTGQAGIEVGPTGKTLTIEGTGSLNATGGADGGVGIGMSKPTDEKNSCGNIIIKSGTINAEGGVSDYGYGGAGIGTSCSKESDVSCGDISILGGDVTAKGASSAAGIGTGASKNTNSNSCGNILISGGVVSSLGIEGAGIGTGEANSSITRCGDITISGGEVTANSKKSYSCGAGIGTGPTNNGETYCGVITILDGSKVSAEAENGPGIGTAKCYGVSGIVVGECAGIEIKGGVVIAKGCGVGNAGIGTGCATHTGATSVTNKCVYITISGGTITANALSTGPGIGVGRPYLNSGDNASCKTYCGPITITGGTVTATSGNATFQWGSSVYGPYGGAGIGTAVYGGSGNALRGTMHCGDITISGGNVIARKGVSTSTNSCDIGRGDVDTYDINYLTLIVEPFTITLDAAHQTAYPNSRTLSGITGYDH